MTDPWDDCIFTYVREWLIFMENVGSVNIPVPCILKGRIPKSSNFVLCPVCFLVVFWGGTNFTPDWRIQEANILA